MSIIFNNQPFKGSAVYVRGDNAEAIERAIEELKRNLRKDGWYIEKDKRMCYNKKSLQRHIKEMRQKLKIRG
jgi:ribosomal protein S21